MNAICLVYHDTQLPRSNFRFWDLFCLLMSLSQYKPRRFAKPCYRKTWQLHSHLKITAANKGGIVYCLGSPDKFVMYYRVFTSKLYVTYHSLLHPDRSCCRDKVNRAASQRSVVFVFAETSRQLHHDQQVLVHLSGLAKNAAPRHGRQLIKPPGR